MSNDKQNRELAGKLKEIIEGLIPEDKVKASLAGDKQFLEGLSSQVVEKLIAQGYVEDRLLSQKEAMALLGIKTVATFGKLKYKKKNPLVPIRVHDNGRPKYRTSDINKYIRSLEKSS